MTVPRLIMSAATMTPNALLCRLGLGGVAVRRRGTVSEGPCSPFAHRRCAYTWTSQHTSVAMMQVRRTTMDASVRGGTGWPGSNPGTPAGPHQANHRSTLHPGATQSSDRLPRAIIPCGTSLCRAPWAA
jgi:hypothetical protein